ncbi:hypothetical protein RGQ29_017476 [Quercus rubra]|uniref:Uncharacterized protein n=1 Tax=Quercus rubra TaxID=3512 RepID=A0AAN7FP14_QUERU|nr:hypothetical protein RGQ29_017476 [Quercus rubra]
MEKWDLGYKSATSCVDKLTSSVKVALDTLRFSSCLLPQNAEALLCSRSWLFTGQVIPDHDDEHLVEDFEHLCISGHVTYNDEI